MVAEKKIENTRYTVCYLLNVEWDRAIFCRKNPGEHPHESLWFPTNASRGHFDASLHRGSNSVYNAPAQSIGG